MNRSSQQPAQQTRAIPVTVSLFGGAWAPEPTHEIAGTWRELVEGIRTGLQRTVPAPRNDSEQAWQRAKRRLPAMVCAPFSGSRGDDTVGGHTVLFLDVDRPKPDTLTRLQRFQAVAFESASSRRKAPDELRLKVGVALTEPIPPHAVKAARSALALELGLDPVTSGVAGADAASQLTFIGRIDGTPERKVWAYDGEPWTPPPPGEAPPEREQAEAGASEPLYDASHVPDLSALAPLIEPAEPGGMRRSSRKFCRGLGGGMAREGIHPEAVETSVYALHDGRSDQPAERAALARETAEQFYAGDARAAGMSAIRDHVAELVEDPDAVIAHIREQCLGSWERAAADVWSQYIAERRRANDVADCEHAPAEQSPTTDGLLWVSAADLAKPLQPVTWTCKRLGLAVGGRPHVFAARAGAGKTMSAQALGLAVATGGELFGEFECRKGVVRHIDLDQGQQATQRRYQWLAAGQGIDLRDVPNLACSFFGFALTERAQISAKAMSLLERSVRGADLVIIDALRSLAPGLDENASEFGAVLAALSAITNETGVTWLVLHHSGKSEAAWLRGTTAIEDRLGSGWELVQGDDMTSWVHAKRSELACDFEAEFTTRLVKHLANGREAASITVVPAGGGRGASGAPTADERRTVADFVKGRPDGVSRSETEMAMRGRIARDRVRGVVDVLLSDHVLAPQGSGKLQRLMPGPKIDEVSA